MQGVFPLHEHIGLVSSPSVTAAHAWEAASRAFFVVDTLLWTTSPPTPGPLSPHHLPR